MEKLTPEKVAEMLHGKGMAVSPEQAALMLELLKKLAEIVVVSYLANKREQIKKTA